MGRGGRRRGEKKEGEKEGRRKRRKGKNEEGEKRGRIEGRREVLYKQCYVLEFSYEKILNFNIE